MSETNEDAPFCTHGNGKRATCQLCILEDFQMRTPAEFASALAAAGAEVEDLKRQALMREIDCANEMARANAAEEERDRMAEEVGQLAADLAAVREVEEFHRDPGNLLTLGGPGIVSAKRLARDGHYVSITEIAKADGFIALGRALAAQEKPPCEHQWADARNERVLSGEVCVRCGVIRAGNAALGGNDD